MPLTTVRGAEAVLRWGYYDAGALRAWSMTKAEDGSWVLTANVVSVDTFRVAQRPLVFVAPHQHGSWRWNIQELQIADGTLSARLGPVEKCNVLTVHSA